MSCGTGCFETFISSCNDIIIKASLPPNQPLFWIVNKSGTDNIYQKLTITDDDGNLLIAEADLPAGFLTTGNFLKIQIREGNDYLQPVSFLFNEIDYLCIMAELGSFKLQDTDNSGVNVIQ